MACDYLDHDSLMVWAWSCMDGMNGMDGGADGIGLFLRWTFVDNPLIPRIWRV